MKGKGSLFAGFICFVIALAFFWIGRTEITKSMMLMGVVSFWFLMAFLFALHADTAGNLQIIVQNFPVFRSVFNGTNGTRTTDVQVAPPVNDEEASHG